MEVLDFDRLVNAYYENLVTTLRNFSPGPEYLDSWVHDENPNESLHSLFEAAAGGELDGLVVKVRSSYRSSIDLEQLKNNLAGLGILSWDETADSISLHLIFHKKKFLYRVHPAYQAGLKLAGKNLIHQGSIIHYSESKNETILSANCQGTTLQVLVSPGGIVCESKYTGAHGELIPLMERFCELLMSRPLQEAADHAILRLEKSLRDETVAAPVLGLVTPENADPIFLIPLKLIRMLYSSFLEKQPEWLVKRNEWVDPLSELWVSLPEDSKIHKLNQLIRQICQERTYPYDGMEALSVKNGTRVVLSCHQHVKQTNFGHHLMVIEKELKKRLEPQIELSLESLEDRNKRETRTSR